MNHSFYFLGLGILMGILKSAIEYSYWGKKKNEARFNGIGFSIIFCILVFVFVVSDSNWSGVLITILTYWNIFELTTNWTHNQPLFYVGESAYFDKLLRRITVYVEYLKCSLHVLTISGIIILYYYGS